MKDGPAPHESTTPTSRVVPFDVALREAREQVTIDGRPCTGLDPVADGALHLAWQGPERLLEARLVPASAATVGGRALPMGPFVLEAAGDLPATALAEAKSGLLAAWKKGLGVWIAYGADPKREHVVQPTADGVARFLASKLLPGVVFWDDWRFEHVRRVVERDTATWCLRFASPERAHVTVELGPSVPRDTGSSPLGGWRAVDVSEPREAAAVLPVVGFLLSRVFPPRTAWASAPVADAWDGRPWQEIDGLIANCYRGSFEAHARPSRVFGTWGYPDSFGITGELTRHTDTIVHASRECPIVIGSIARPVGTSVRAWTRGASSPRLAMPRVYATDLDDAAIALGGDERLKQLCDELAHASGPDDRRRVMITQGCESHLIGDSPGAIGRGCFRHTGVTLSVIEPVRPNFEEPDSSNTWARVIAALEVAPEADRRPRTVNLVGYGHPTDPFVEDLVSLLAEVGIGVVSVCLPVASPEHLARFGSAELSVVSPWQPVHDAVVPALQARGLRALQPALPYGWTGTLRWLQALTGALGIPHPSPGLHHAWRARYEAAAGPYLARLAVQPLRFAFAYDKGSLGELLSPRFFFGADPLDLVDVAGVAASVVHLPDTARDDYGDASDLVARLGQRGVRLVEATAGAPAIELLRDLGLDAVYSDLPEPAVVKSSGAVPVAISDLPLGLTGAAEIARRMWLLRRLRLYRRLRPPPRTTRGVSLP